MYAEKMLPILQDLEEKEIEIAGGSTVGMLLSITNSLIKYISNMTLGKKKYEDVQDEIKNVLEKAENLKKYSLNVIDKDKEVLEELLSAYKLRKENPNLYETKCKQAVEFCMEVVEKSFKTFHLSEEISKIGNKMLSSDFEICKIYSKACVEAGIVNVNINLDGLNDEMYKNEISNKCEKILKEVSYKNNYNFVV